MMKHPATKYILAAVFSALALWLAFRRTDFAQLYDQLTYTNIAVIIAGTFVMFLSHLVRSWRFKMFLRPMKADTSLWTSFQALLAGYAMNNVIPRSGDIVRPVLFSRKEDVPVTATVAALLIERLSDLIGLAFVLLLSLYLFDEQIAIGWPGIIQFKVVITVVLLVIFAFGLLVLFSEKATVKTINFITKKLPERMHRKIQDATTALEHGLREARSGAAMPLVVGTLGIWLLYAASMYVSLHAFHSPDLVRVGFVGCILLQTMSGLAFTVPTPGGTGTYHFFVSQSLAAIFHVPPTVAIAYATVTHASNYILTTITGVTFMLKEGMTFGEVTKDSAAKRELTSARKTVMGKDPVGVTK